MSYWLKEMLPLLQCPFGVLRSLPLCTLFAYFWSYANTFDHSTFLIVSIFSRPTVCAQGSRNFYNFYWPDLQRLLLAE